MRADEPPIGQQILLNNMSTEDEQKKAGFWSHQHITLCTHAVTDISLTV